MTIFWVCHKTILGTIIMKWILDFFFFLNLLKTFTIPNLNHKSRKKYSIILYVASIILYTN